MTGAIVTPGGGGGGCSLLEEQPAQMNSVVTKRARNEACRTANRGFAKIRGAPLFPADLSCGRRATRKLGSCAIRFASRLRPSVCENETSMTSIQAMRWFYCRLLDAPKMPKYRAQILRERGSASANPFRPPSVSSVIGGINLEELAESRWPRLRTNIRHRTRALVSRLQSPTYSDDPRS